MNKEERIKELENCLMVCKLHFDYLVHLHMCEQEGIASGMPSPDEWIKAVDKAAEACQMINVSLNKINRTGICKSCNLSDTKCATIMKAVKKENGNIIMCNAYQ